MIFRYNPNGQEAVVPLESRNATGYILAFDNTAGTATGIAINSVSTQAVNVPVIVRNDAGAHIATDTLNLAANGHLAFTLGRPDRFQVFRKPPASAAPSSSTPPPAPRSARWASASPSPTPLPRCRR